MHTAAEISRIGIQFSVLISGSQGPLAIVRDPDGKEQII